MSEELFSRTQGMAYQRANAKIVILDGIAFLADTNGELLVTRVR